MSLPGRLVERLEAALLDAFPEDDALDRLVRRVGVQARVPGRATLVTRVGELIEVVDAQGRVLDLLEAALDLAPGNVVLAAARAAILAQVEGGQGANSRSMLRSPTEPGSREASTPTPANGRDVG